MLETYLKEHYGITKYTLLKSPIHNQIYSLSEILDTIKKRKTEANVIDALEGYQIEDKEDVLMYLTGIATRFEIENII